MALSARVPLGPLALIVSSRGTASPISSAALVVLAPSVGIAATVTAVVAVGLSAWLLIRFTLARIPGLTGDIYGALCEVGETVCIVTLAAYWSG